MVRAPAVGDSTPNWNPAVIFEVFSGESTAPELVTVHADSTPISSVRYTIVPATNVMAGTIFKRIVSDWMGRLLRADSFARMPETSIERPLDELCERIDVAARHTDAVAAD